ncbi:MAG: nuclear transport factor 2 family protein [Myxococcota bacterium]
MEEPTFVQEYQSIAAVLRRYSEGAAQASSEHMRPSFADQATVYYVDEGEKLAGGSVQQALFDALDGDFPESPAANGVVVRIDIVGTVASARVDTDNLAGVRYTDFFHLLKVDGRWTIISKAFHAHG